MRLRPLASILTLIVVATTWAPAAADEETSVGWLCQLAFERGLERDPTDASRFDDAIGACGSGREFAAAAASTPDALGNSDPLTFLVARCADEVTGLGRYQSCASVADLVSAAAPAPSPGSEPSPVPEAVEPDRVVIDDDTGGLQFDDADPLYVPVPPGIKAHVPGAWKVKYFDVTGKNLKQLDRSVRRESKKVCGDHAWGCVTNRRVATPRGRTLSDDERCWVSSISWKDYKPIVWMPRWKTDRLVRQDVLRWWTAELARTAAHEAEHIRIDNQFRQWIQDQIVVGTPCGAIERRFAKLDKKLEKAHGRFHAREDLRDRIPWPYVPPGEPESIGR